MPEETYDYDMPRTVQFDAYVRSPIQGVMWELAERSPIKATIARKFVALAFKDAEAHVFRSEDHIGRSVCSIHWDDVYWQLIADDERDFSPKPVEG